MRLLPVGDKTKVKMDARRVISKISFCWGAGVAERTFGAAHSLAKEASGSLTMIHEAAVLLQDNTLLETVDSYLVLQLRPEVNFGSGNGGL